MSLRTEQGKRQYTVEDLRKHILSWKDLDDISPEQLLGLPIKKAVETLLGLSESKNFDTSNRAQLTLVRFSRLLRRRKQFKVKQ